MYSNRYFSPFNEMKEKDSARSISTSVLNSPENNRKRENKKGLITKEMATLKQLGTNF